MADKLERIYTVPLAKAYETVRTKRARRAVALLRSFIARHLKANNVVISNATNAFLWQRSMQHPPRRIKVRAIKEDDSVRVYLQDEKPEVKKEEKKPEAKEEPKNGQAKKEDKKEEQKPGQKPVEQKKETQENEKKTGHMEKTADKK